jgi:hypothetical protein
MKPGVAYRFRSKAVDYAGNTGSAWATSPTLTAVTVQQTSTGIKYSSGWVTSTNASYLGGTTKARSVIGASASYTFSGRAIGFVSVMGPSRGRVKVYVDGVYLKTVDLYSASARYRALVYSRSWTSSGTHTIRLVLAGPSSRPRVDIDAFVVVR